MFTCLDGLSPTLREIGIEMVGTTHNIALALLSIFFAVALVWNFVQGFIKSGKPVILSSLITMLISALFVILYIPILNGIGAVTCGVINSFPEYDTVSVAYGGTLEEWGMNTLALFFNDESSLERLVMANGVGMIKLVIGFLRAIVIAFLAVVGPLAVVLDLLPLFRGTALKWFKGIVIVALWGVTLKILDGFLFTYISDYNGGSSWTFWFGEEIGTDSGLSFFLTSVCFIVMYLLVPFLTSLYIGSSMVSGMAGKMFSIATLGTAMAVKGTAMASKVGSARRSTSSDQKTALGRSTQKEARPATEAV